MQLYSQAAGGPGVAMSFWNKKMFDEYRCPNTIEMWLEKGRIDTLRKKIAKNVGSIKITELTMDAVAGLCFSGSRTYDQGGQSTFSFNAFNHDAGMSVADFGMIRHDWHVTTSSQKFKGNVEFIGEDSEFVSFTIDKDTIIFEGVNEFAVVTESISHSVENSTRVKLSSMLFKRYLKVVSSAFDLHKSLTISFSSDNKNAPLLFSYDLDHEVPKSHFSVYLVPCHD